MDINNSTEPWRNNLNSSLHYIGCYIYINTYYILCIYIYILLLSHLIWYSKKIYCKLSDNYWPCTSSCIWIFIEMPEKFGKSTGLISEMHLAPTQADKECDPWTEQKFSIYGDRNIGCNMVNLNGFQQFFRKHIHLQGQGQECWAILQGQNKCFHWVLFWTFRSS